MRTPVRSVRPYITCGLYPCANPCARACARALYMFYIILVKNKKVNG